MSTIPTLEELKRFDTSHDLILSLSPTEEIIQFNKESERFTGYLRDEVLHKKLSDFLIPQDSCNHWKDLFGSILQNMWIDNFVMPIKTKGNEIHMVIWTGFLVKDERGTVKDICIFGKPLKTKSIEHSAEMSTEPVSRQEEPLVKPTAGEIVPSVVSQENQKEPLIEPQGQNFTKTVHQDQQKEALIQPTVDEKVDSAVQKFQQKQHQVQPEVHKNVDTIATQDIPVRYTQVVPGKPRVKKILFAREQKITEEQSSTLPSEKETQPVDLEKPSHDVPSDEPITSVPPTQRQNDVTSQKLDSLHLSLTDLLRKYETVSTRIEELEEKGRQLEKQQKPVETPQQPAEEYTNPPTKNPTPVNPDTNGEDLQQSEDAEHSFFSDPFGLKRQHKELDLKKQQVELRMKQLEAFETRLLKEKDIFHARVEEFSKWQEKLMLLESAIEKRRQELMKQEDFMLEKSNEPTSPQPVRRSDPGIQKSNAGITHCKDENLDKIEQSAAIIQRGILKQINTQFLELLGYPLEEIVEKSYFDFIAVEGLADVEKYYLDRLKGESVSVYRTVFSTKDNTKIPVEVSIKQTIYNGEKAEIAIITCLDSCSE